MEESERKTTRAAAKAVKTDGRPPSEYTLVNGIVLKIKAVPPLLVNRAQSLIERPKPPVVFLEEKGREEENPNHPDYIAAVLKYREELSMVSAKICFLIGTSIKTIPEGWEGPEGETWVANLEIAGIPAGENERERYLNWLQCYAMTSEMDITGVLFAVSRASGVTEEEVRAAAESFRSLLP